MYFELQDINKKPEIFSFYTAEELWNNEFTSQKMLEYHLNPDVDVSSRKLDFIHKSIEWITQTFSINEHSKVCDFGCAVGHYTTGFAEIGAEVTGIDFSKRSIAYAEALAVKKSLDIDYRCMNYLDFSEEISFDLITMIMCDFCALSYDQRDALLSIFRRILSDDGAILLDVYSHAAFESVNEQAVYEKNQLAGFWADTDYYAFVNTFKYEDDKVGLDKYTIIEPTSSKVVYNWLQYYSLDSLAEVLKKNGLYISKVYGDVAGSEYSSDSSEFAVVIRK